MMRRVLTGVLVVAAMMLVAPALASASGVAWKADVFSATRVSPGQQVKYMVALQNVGDVASDGTGALDITLPSGITGVSLARDAVDSPLSSWTCSDPAGAASVHCDLTGVVAPGGRPERVFSRPASGQVCRGFGVAR